MNSSSQDGQGNAEAQAIADAKKGDAAAFEALYNVHKRRVYSLCLRMIGNAAEAEDLTQEAFLQMFRKIGTFRGEAAFSTWLHRLTVNEVLQARRSAGRRNARVTLAADPLELEAAPAPAGGNPGAGSSDLAQAIARLPAGARMVFVLHDVEGYQHDEVAALLDIAEGTSKAQLFRARRLLREMLDR